MICFKSKRPILRIGDCLISDYNFGWLADALDAAADELEMELPFRDDLVAAVLTYLEESCPWEVMPIDMLYKRIRSMLQEVGMEKLAAHLPEMSPPVSVNIDEIARRNPLLLFFANDLNHELSTLRSKGLTHYRFTGERECVLEIQGSRHWNKRSEALLEEIHFILSRYRE